MSLDDGRRDGETEAGASARSSRIRPAEALEDPRLVPRWDARATVHDRQHGPPRLTVRGHLELNVARTVAQRIVDQDPGQAGERLGVAVEHHGSVVWLHDDSPIGPSRLAGDIGNERPEVGRLALDPTAGIGTGQAQQVVDEPAEAFTLGHDIGQRVGSVVARCVRTLHQEARVVANRGQRRPQLV